jgi:hypothetical protein
MVISAKFREADSCAKVKVNTTPLGWIVGEPILSVGRYSSTEGESYDAH